MTETRPTETERDRAAEATRRDRRSAERRRRVADGRRRARRGRRRRDDGRRRRGRRGRDRPSLAERLEQEGDIAADYLEELLDIADLDGDLDMDVEGDRAAVSIVGADLQPAGRRRNGEVLEALQELTRLAVYRETGERSRLMLDISRPPRRARARELEELADETVAAGQGVRRAGRRCEPMSPFERKVVHDAVAAAGLTSESEGVEPRRYVVVLPWLTSAWRPTVSRETPSAPPDRRRGGCFRCAPAAGRAVRRRCWPTEGVVRGLIGPREVPRLWERHLLNCAVLGRR